jgi:hypothetical protein
MYKRLVEFLAVFVFLWAGTVHAQSRVQWVGPFPGEIQESSGLLVWDDLLITHNDSGNSPDLFLLDSASLAVRRKVRISNASNTDWEDLAQDDEYIYIGDIGNNSGNRRDLKILRVRKSEMASSETVQAGIISFQYEDQTSYAITQNSDWDAEALYAGTDSLWVFTKQWKSKGSVVYAIPKTPGEHQAVRKGTLDVRGLITGASGIPDQNGILLLGYSGQLQPFLVVTHLPHSLDSIQKKPEKEQVSIAFAQAEGIAVALNGIVYVSSEVFSSNLISTPAGVYRVWYDGDLKAARPDPKPRNIP